jgi:hypothetical protein
LMKMKNKLTLIIIIISIICLFIATTMSMFKEFGLYL